MRRIVPLAFVLLLGCDEAETEGPPTDAEPATWVLYGPTPSTKLSPFPSDRYAVADDTTKTGLRVAISTETTGDEFASLYPSIVDQLDELDGFSTVGGVTVHFSGPVDPASFTRAIDDYANADAPLRLIDVDPSSDEFGTARGLTVRYFPQDGEDSEYVLVAQPSEPLRQRTKYLFVVTNQVKDSAGDAIGASEDMAAVLEGEEAGAYEDAVREALDAVGEEQELTSENVVLATLFTTQTVQDKTIGVVDAVRASPAPELDGEVTIGRVGEGEDARVEFLGRFTAPHWLDSDGRFRFQEDGSPVPGTEASLEFSLVFNHGDVTGPRPVVIFAHGMTSSKNMTWDVAEWLSGLGVVVIGIDAPEHGSRLAEGVGGIDIIFRFLGVDGVDEGTFDLARGADNFRQMASDQTQLVRAIKGPIAELDLLPAGAPDGVPDAHRVPGPIVRRAPLLYRARAQSGDPGCRPERRRRGALHGDPRLADLRADPSRPVSQRVER